MDVNPDILVFKTGAWNVITDEFGHTTPEDCITDTRTCGVDWEPPDEEVIDFLDKELFGKAHVDKEMRDIWAAYQCTALRGGCASRWWMLNLGKNGKYVLSLFFYI